MVHEDETTSKLDVDSLSMRGAQREITGHFLHEGYEPAGRWEQTTPLFHDLADVSKSTGECVRRFRLKA